MCRPEAFSTRYLAVVDRLLGYRALPDARGDVVVTHGAGWAFSVENTAPEDPEFLHLLATFEFDGDHAVLRSACTTANGQVKGAKLVPVFDGDRALITCHVEMVVAPESCLPARDHLAAVLPRAITMLESGLTVLHDQLEQVPGLAV